MPARLSVHFPSRPVQVLALPEGGRTVVGRDRDCGVVLDDDRVSRRHAALASAGSGWTVADLGSKNGTLVDGAPLASAGEIRPLGERSWISFGGLVARFERLPREAGTLEEERRHRFTTLAAQRGLAAGAGLAELLPRVVDSMLALSSAERGFLLLARADGDLEVAARAGISPAELRAPEFGGSVGAVQRALASGRPVVSTDALTDAELAGRASIVGRGIRALICVPVRALDRLIGVMYADSREPGAAFTELDLDILEALAAQAGLAIGVARLGEELRGLAGRIAADPASDTWHGLVAAHAPPPGAGR